jgi:hypothetical protein
MLAVIGLLVVHDAGRLQMKGPGQASGCNHFTWPAHLMPLIQVNAFRRKIRRIMVKQIPASETFNCFGGLKKFNLNNQKIVN